MVILKRIVPMLCAIFCASPLGVFADETNDELFIAKAPELSADQKAVERMNAEFRAAASRTAELCKILAVENDTADDNHRQNAVSALKNDVLRKGDSLLLTCADSRYTVDPVARMGAIKAFNAVNASGPNVPNILARAAVLDPSEDVRKTAVAEIKSFKSHRSVYEPAVGGMLNLLRGAFNPNGEVANLSLRDNAAGALRGLGDDKFVYQASLYYVTIDVRATQTELVGFDTRSIGTVAIQNANNGGALVVPLSLPIQFPKLRITRVRTTVKVPSVNALETLSGQAFGEDVDAWDKWIQKQ